MSQSSKKHRAEREARQEKQAKSVINWICVGLLILAVIFLLIYICM